MIVFADTIGNLRYRNGLVSIQLVATASGQAGVEVHIPFVDFVEMTNALSREALSMREVHQRWLKQELEAPALQTAAAAPAEKRLKLGKRLGSV